ncbi:MAG: hypothetical protein RBR15_00600 [Sphaerochaeta sp.]|nr:hypothetical protein [Sphaerochaeta sp.]
MRELEYTKTCMYEYLEEVLEYYRKAADASFGEWPDREIGWSPFTKNANFYERVKQWFAARDITLIRGQNTNRYLSTFILAAEFPPTLGYSRLVAELVSKCGWLSLYRSPQTFLDKYIESVAIDTYTIAQRQSLVIGSEGYFAFLELVTILASIRYLLGTSDNLEEICVKVAIEYERDIELVQRIASAYHDSLIPPVNDAHSIPVPQFSFQLKQDGIWKLVIKHNLHKSTRIQTPSSVELSRFSIGSLSCIAGEGMLQINTSSDSVQLEALDNHIDLDCGILKDHFFITKRNESLKNIQFLLSVTDKKTHMFSLNIGGIQRQDNFLLFDMQGNELVTKSRLFKRGQPLMVVPLNPQIGQALIESSSFRRLMLPETLPIFVLEGNPEKVEIDGVLLHFCETPFSIQLRDQTPWEQTFGKKSRIPYYFFSPLMQISLEGDLAGKGDPAILLVKVVERKGGKQYDPVSTRYEDNRIIPTPRLPSPGMYKLIVKFGNDVQREQFFRLLPIRNIRLLGEKHMQIKLYAHVASFELLGDQQCSKSVTKDLVDLQFNEYGTHQIDAKFVYNKGNIQIVSVIKFFFKAQQEVVGYFSKELFGTKNEGLSLQRDFLPNSYFEFRKNSLRDPAQRYTISAYMEGDSQHGLFPRLEKVNVAGNDKVPLFPLVNSMKKHGYSRLLLLVHCGGKELFRATFTNSLTTIIDLYIEWEKGYYHELLVLPIYSLDPFTVTDLTSIPDNSIVYGRTLGAEGNIQYATNGLCIPPTKESVDPFHRLLDSFTTDIPEETAWNILLSILTSPALSYSLIAWYTKASRWAHPYDIPAFAYLLDRFPILAAWSDLARNPNNRDEPFALITNEGKFLHSIGKYLVPNGLNLASNPRYSPELMTLGDIEVLEHMNLLPSHDESAKSLIRLSYFCAIPFVTGSKPVLSWLTLFWFQSYCEKHNLREAYIQFTQSFLNTPHAVTVVSGEYTRVMPRYIIDSLHEQNIRNMVVAEQSHYLIPMFTKIPGLFDFLACLESSSFTSGLTSIIEIAPLWYAKPYLEGSSSSSKWKFIIFLSLTVVCTQLDKQELLQKLHGLWKFTPMQYTYLVQWVNTNQSTAWIYNAYYEYWMKLIWGGLHV